MTDKEYEALLALHRRMMPYVTEEEIREMYRPAVEKGLIVLPKAVE